MNGKFILLMMLCLNLISFSFSVACANSDEMSCSGGNTALLTAFIKVDESQVSEGGLVQNWELSDGLSQASQNLTQQQSGTTNAIVSGFTAFVDGLKMIGSFLSLLTPIPMLTFFFTLGMPQYLNLLLGAPIIALYMFALAEFVRGGSL